MRDKILRGTAHLTVVRSDGKPMLEYQEVATRVLAVGGVAAASGTTYDSAVIIGPNASAYAVLRGIDGTSARPASDIAGSIISGSVQELAQPRDGTQNIPPALLGAELAARTGLKVGDVAEVIAAHSGFSSTNGRKRQVQVAGIFRSGLFEYDSTWIYLPLETAAAFSGNAHAASVVSVQVKNIYEVKSVAAQVRQVLGSSYMTVDWQEANRPLFTALALERRIGLIIIALIVLIAALNITTTLILIVMERRHDIAILSAMGATTRSITSIFVFEGAIVGGLGAAAGVALGAIAILITNRYRLISLPADVYSISNVPLTVHFRDLAIAGLVALVLSIVATIYPARAAARIRPAEMLRDVN
ncbi:MAG TPA: FtsX-like permease family protein, partial [Pyrinomonadaceae bacterium]|nr:FtsX-like permease family protein [Pyrinomonadaceae bacterium]